MRVDKVESPAESLYASVEIVAFTGTQIGMTKAQKKAFKSLLQAMKPKVFIHGDCIGADAEAHDIAEELGLEIWIRPCFISQKRAYKKGKLLADPEDPIARNHKMVDESHALIGCPKSEQQELRSGTWSTIRYAKKCGSLRWLVHPDGSVITPLDV